MCDYTYDRDFMKEAYPLLVSLEIPKAEILLLYNQCWAEEARNNYNWRQHCVSYELFQVGTLEIGFTSDDVPGETDGTELLSLLSANC